MPLSRMNRPPKVGKNEFEKALENFLDKYSFKISENEGDVGRQKQRFGLFDEDKEEWVIWCLSKDDTYIVHDKEIYEWIKKEMDDING